MSYEDVFDMISFYGDWKSLIFEFDYGIQTVILLI